MSSEKQGGRNLEIDLANHDFEDEMDEIHQKQGVRLPPLPLRLLRPCVHKMYFVFFSGLIKKYCNNVGTMFFVELEKRQSTFRVKESCSTGQQSF